MSCSKRWRPRVPWSRARGPAATREHRLVDGDNRLIVPPDDLGERARASVERYRWEAVRDRLEAARRLECHMKRPLRVCFHAPQLWPLWSGGRLAFTGGAEVQQAQIAKGFAARGSR